jgi:hypothetical protein
MHGLWCPTSLLSWLCWDVKIKICNFCKRCRRKHLTPWLSHYTAQTQTPPKNQWCSVIRNIHDPVSIPHLWISLNSSAIAITIASSYWTVKLMHGVVAGPQYWIGLMCTHAPYCPSSLWCAIFISAFKKCNTQQIHGVKPPCLHAYKKYCRSTTWPKWYTT